MKLKDLLREVTPTRMAGPGEADISGVCYDSRKAAPGCLFVAVRGFRSDGHAYIPAALERGAAAPAPQLSAARPLCACARACVIY